MKIFVYSNKEIIMEDVIIPKFGVGIAEKDKNGYFIVNFVAGNQSINILSKDLTIFDPIKVGDSFENKVCNICHRFLPTFDFDKNQNGKDNRTIRRPSCNECRKIIDGVRMSSKDKKEFEKTKPYLTIFTCPICKKKTIPGLTVKVVLDHNHKTGKPRAWICDSCNTGIGRFKDEIELLKNAIKFLEKD